MSNNGEHIEYVGQDDSVVFVPQKRRGRPPRSAMLNAIKEVAGDQSDPNRVDETKPPVKKKERRFLGVDGEFEEWMGKRWWVPKGLTVEDVIKRQNLPPEQIESQLIALYMAKEERVKAYHGTDPKKRDDDFDLEHNVVRPERIKPNFNVINPNVELRSFLIKHQKTLQQKLWEVAMGYTAIVQTPKGQKKVYTTAPDRMMLVYLADHLFDKPKIKAKRMVEEGANEQVKFTVTDAE